MGKSYIITYIGQYTKDGIMLEQYKMRLADFVGDFTHSQKGLQAGDKIKIYKQATGQYLGYILIKKDIPRFQQDKDYHFIDLPDGINWHNQWEISKKYWSFIRI